MLNDLGILKGMYWYKKKILNKLFNELQEVVPLTEIGYHEIRDGKLHPIHKTETNEISSKRWKKAHSKNPVYVNKTVLLQEVIENKETIVINDTHLDERSAKEFGVFGIESVMIIPILDKKSVVRGFIEIPSIHKTYSFTDEEVSKSKQIVQKYSTSLV